MIGDVALECRPTAARTRSAPTGAPTAGRPFTTEAARWNAAVLHAEELVRSGLAGISPAASLAEPGRFHSSALLYKSAIDRAARRITAAWLSGVLAGDLQPKDSFLDAESWFCGSATTAAALPLDCAQHALAVLRELVRADGALAMLPYALDPAAHEYRRDVVNKRSDGKTRSIRKASGAFFTPADVVSHIVGQSLAGSNVHSGMRVLDPAAGTGVFLRTAFAELLKRGFPADSARQSLFGIDIDERCVDMAAFVLLVDYLLANDGPSCCVHDIWTAIRSNCLAGDALIIMSGAQAEQTLFGGLAPEVGWPKMSFDVIVGNPPYARAGARSDLPELRTRFRSLKNASATTDIYPAFVEMLCCLAQQGAGSMVVPMSVGYGSTQQMRELRLAAQEAGGAWTFEFFDRTPDALFGDDVKQRTAILTRKASEPYCVTSSPVMRWTSRNRSTLFERIPRVDLGDHDITGGVPKVGSSAQAAVVRALRSTETALEDGLVLCTRVTVPVAGDNGAVVFVAGTAYNWLNVYRTAGSITPGIERPTASQLTALTANSVEEADMIFALLSSRVVYWLWRVETDVFHVPTGWIKRLPFSPLVLAQPRSTLAELGRRLWTSIKDHPVQSLNGGRSTVSYCPHAAADVLDLIDAEIVTQFGLPKSFASEVATFVRELTTAGRDSAGDHGLRRALASWREG